jgi:hypothetical protein
LSRAAGRDIEAIPKEETMKKFLVLYESSVPAEEQIKKAPPEQVKVGMELWMKWMQKAGSAIVDVGAPLGNAAVVKGSAGASGASKVSGYSIVQANSRQDVERLYEDHPHFKAPGAVIDILEFLSMPGMPK